MGEIYNNDNPLTMKKLAVRLDAIEDTLAGLDRNSSAPVPEIVNSNEGIVEELRKLVDAENEANKRRLTMTATHVSRIVLEVLVVIALCAFAMGCTSELPGLILGPAVEEGNVEDGHIDIPDMESPVVPGETDIPAITPDTPAVPDAGIEDDIPAEPEPEPVVKTLRGSIWKCAPIVVDSMEITRLEFNEAKDDGRVVFLVRGRERTRDFFVVEEGIKFMAPETLWTYETDYETYLHAVSSDGVEIAFVPSTGR